MNQESQADAASDNIQAADLVPQELIEYIPEEKRGEFIREFALQIELYSGSIPHPSIVARWEKVVPGSADRILTLSEDHQGHRMEMERVMFAEFIGREKLGMWFYFIIALVMIIGGIAVILAGYSTAGLVALAAPVATIAGAFIFSYRRTGNESRGSRDPQSAKPLSKPVDQGRP